MSRNNVTVRKVAKMFQLYFGNAHMRTMGETTALATEKPQIIFFLPDK